MRRLAVVVLLALSACRGGGEPAAVLQPPQAVKDAVFGTKRRQGMIETMAKQTSRTVGNKLGQQILRGVLGSIFGGKR